MKAFFTRTDNSDFLPFITGLLKETDVPSAVLDYLLKVAPEQVAGTLESFLMNKKRDTYYIQRDVAYLEKIDPDLAFVLLKKFICANKGNIQYLHAALFHFARIKNDDEGAEFLLQLYAESNEKAQDQVVSTLLRLSSPRVLPVAMSLINEWLSVEDHFPLRAQGYLENSSLERVERALLYLKDRATEEMIPMLRGFLRGSIYQLRHAVARVLSSCPDYNFRDFDDVGWYMFADLKLNEEPHCSQNWSEEHLWPVLTLLRDPDKRVRFHVREALSVIKHPRKAQIHRILKLARAVEEWHTKRTYEVIIDETPFRFRLKAGNLVLSYGVTPAGHQTRPEQVDWLKEKLGENWPSLKK